MMPCCRPLLLAAIGIVLLSPLLDDPAFPEQQDKEKTPDKSQEKPPAPSQSHPDTQPTPSKPLTEPKPQSAPPAKPDALPKLSTEPKPQSQPAPPVKPESPPEREVKEKEKEKEASKKPLGSLILSVKLALLGDARFFHYEIEAEEDGQTITLRGKVAREEERVAAAEVARSVPGVKAVVNKLEADKDLVQALIKKQDESITVLVKERFARSATLKAANFSIKTEEGVVSLGGAVRFQVIVLEAAEAARQVPGVRAVNTEKIRLEGEG